jgi:tetratricopeptide (TPR) repeat protein
VHKLRAALAVLLVCALAGRVSAAPPATATPLQAAYDQAQSAYDKGDWQQAADSFAGVLAVVNPASRSAGIVRIRRADALMHLHHLDEARAEAETGVAVLKASASGPDAELCVGYLTLGDIFRLDLAYEDAITAYVQAKAAAAGDDAADEVDLAQVGVIQAAMVIHPELAASTADAIIANSARFTAMSKNWRAQIYSLRARAALNLHDPNSANAFMEKALALGDIDSNQVSLADVEVRNDAALVYEQLHDSERVQMYLARTGAGHLPDQHWFAGADIDVPLCGPLIQPSDTVVVEFSIADDGTTVGAAPVYASRSGLMAIEFAKAVGEWRWSPTAVAKAKAFWRTAVRVQMRCRAEPPALKLSYFFGDASIGWFRAHGFDERATGAAVAGAQQTPDRLAIAELLTRLKDPDYGDERARLSDGAKLDELLATADAPADARAAIVSMAATGGYTVRGGGARRARILEALLPAIDRTDNGQRAAAWLRLEMAIAFETAGDFKAAQAPLQAVLALPTSVLPHDDPIREVAVLHLSLIDKKLGDPAAAQALQVSSGLTPQGCSLLDVQPVPTSMSADSSDFPKEAQAWGFDGFVSTGFDIGINGIPTDVRVLISYPPFIFDDAAARIVSHFRFTPPLLGTTSMSCAGESKNFDFRAATN